MIVINNMIIFPRDMFVTYKDTYEKLYNIPYYSLLRSNDEGNSNIIDYINSYKKSVHAKSVLNLMKQYPTSLGISITDRCQLRCKYCEYDSKNDGMELSFSDIKPLMKRLFINAQVKKHFDDNQNVSVYFAGGGEPTYSWSVLKETVTYIKNLSNEYSIDVDLGITTNGMINNEQIDFIIKHFNHVMLSFDGTPLLQNNNRPTCNGQCSFTYIDNSIKRISKEMHCVIRSTLWPNQWDNLFSIQKYISDNYPYIDSWEFELVIPEGRAYSENVDVDKEKIVETYIEYSSTDEFINANFKIKNSLFRKQQCLMECGTAYGQHPWVTAQGKIITCLDLKEAAPLIGKITENRDWIFYDYVDTVYDGYIPQLSICKSCIAFNYCGGGCPWKMKYKDNDSPIYCDIRKKYWEIVFSKLLEGKSIGEWQSEEVSENGIWIGNTGIHKSITY